MCALQGLDLQQFLLICIVRLQKGWVAATSYSPIIRNPQICHLCCESRLSMMLKEVPERSPV